MHLTMADLPNLQTPIFFVRLAPPGESLTTVLNPVRLSLKFRVPSPSLDPQTDLKYFFT